jgi:ParB-like chromosome segregation protein Spo0J
MDNIAEPLRALAVPIDELTPDPANTRTHGPENLNAIKASLRVYGQRKPVVVNRRNGVIEAGNGTLEAARALGWTHVATVYVDDDPVTQAGFSIADNRTAELAEWDRDALEMVLATIESDDDDLAAMLQNLAEEISPPDEAEPEVNTDIPEQFNVLVECDSEQAQADLLQRLTTEGYSCRSLIS